MVSIDFFYEVVMLMQSFTSDKLLSQNNFFFQYFLMERHYYTLNQRNMFFSLKTNKSPGYHDISFNTINIFDFIVEPLGHIFNNSLAKSGQDV